MSREIKIGMVCRNEEGRVGVVHIILRSDYTIGDNPNIRKLYEYIPSPKCEYYGVGYDGKEWASDKPEYIADNINKTIDEAVSAPEYCLVVDEDYGLNYNPKR